MKKIVLFFILFITAIVCFSQNQENTITISGRVTDFDAKAISNCKIRVLRSDFTEAYTAFTDKDGFYSIPNVEKGKYMAIYALRTEEYPRELKVAEKDMRLEFWAWNVIADKDLTINPRYHRLELYGTTVFNETLYTPYESGQNALVWRSIISGQEESRGSGSRYLCRA